MGSMARWIDGSSQKGGVQSCSFSAFGLRCDDPIVTEIPRLGGGFKDFLF